MAELWAVNHGLAFGRVGGWPGLSGETWPRRWRDHGTGSVEERGGLCHGLGAAQAMGSVAEIERHHWVKKAQLEQYDPN